MCIRDSHEATERHAALPVPDRIVTDDEVSAARNAAAGAKLDLEGIERDIQRAHGALEQVGGAVARERLRDATEAFELAERQEREIEAEYEAWRLLLDQMKEADAAQASNLGQALVPAIAGRFQELTQRRYQAVQLTAQLATEGIVVSGAVRPTALISVGTREQLSTLYRLCLLYTSLPHTSTHCDQYIGWTGSDDPIVEMTFETEAQRIWRIRKQFGKGGSSLLQESRNGRDFDDVERGRKVDGKLREILRWGIPEPVSYTHLDVYKRQAFR